MAKASSPRKSKQFFFSFHIFVACSDRATHERSGKCRSDDMHMTRGTSADDVDTIGVSVEQGLPNAWDLRVNEARAVSTIVQHFPDAVQEC